MVVAPTLYNKETWTDLAKMLSASIQSNEVIIDIVHMA